MSLIFKIGKLPEEWELISESWARGCGYTDYLFWCDMQKVKPLDEGIFDVVYEALAEEYEAYCSGIW